MRVRARSGRPERALSTLRSYCHPVSGDPDARWLDGLRQPPQDRGDLKPQPCRPRRRSAPITWWGSAALLSSLKGDEDLSGILVFLVEAVGLFGLHTHHDAPFGPSYALPRAKTLSGGAPTG